MSGYWLIFELLSDATFGRGDGVAGLLNREVEHDRYGLPFLRGRTLKGLLSEEVDNLLYALKAEDEASPWQTARAELFGSPGSKKKSGARVRFGRAQLPQEVCDEVAAANLDRTLVLDSLTDLRRQTAVENEGELAGVPVEKSLRTMRVILRQTPFEARLSSPSGLSADAEALLAAAVLAFRRAGTGRNRGRGKLQADLLNEEKVSMLWEAYQRFEEAVK